MSGRGRGWRSAACACLVLPGLFGAVPASAAEDGPDLVLTHGSTNPPAILSPGSTSTWSVGVTSRAVTLHELIIRLMAEGELAELAASSDVDRLVTVEVLSCTGGWVSDACPSGEHTVIPSTALSALGGPASLAHPDGSIAAGLELRLKVTLSPSAVNSAQGLSTRIVARVDASGEPVESGELSPGGLADTGFRLGIFALLGAGAALAGALTSRLAGTRAAGLEPASRAGAD